LQALKITISPLEIPIKKISFSVVSA